MADETIGTSTTPMPEETTDGIGAELESMGKGDEGDEE